MELYSDNADTQSQAVFVLLTVLNIWSIFGFYPPFLRLLRFSEDVVDLIGKGKEEQGS